ncbi:MAG: FAD-binding protein, partial [Pseudonocardiaceae bacterium]
SYGTLGYALRLRIALDPVRPVVALRHVRFDDAGTCAAALSEVCSSGGVDGVDFVDGTVFAPDECYLTLGTFADSAETLSDYTGQQIYYRAIAERATDNLSVRDYLWRWDTDWFWCSRALGAQHPLVRRLWPRRYLRSDVYRRVVAFDRRHGLTDRVRSWRGQPVEEPVIQDVEVPVDRLAEFLDFFHRDIGIAPIWLCPLRQREPVGWTLYPLDPAVLYVNVGFWSSVPLADGQPQGSHNRMIERTVSALGGHKSLYSTSFYDEAEFWRLYNGSAYHDLKRNYDPDGRLPGLYDKCVQER